MVIIPEDVFGKGPWYASMVPDFQPCYECGRETKQGWGFCIRDSTGEIVLDDLSQQQADGLTFVLNNAMDDA